jgi:peptidoglycan/xylan/chitin deacetylase (PgdA/CDA1 family)
MPPTAKSSAASLPARIGGRLLERASWALRTKTIRLASERPFVSFSFDDFPASAVSNGARILERYGFRGTFYAAGSLMGSSHEGISYFQPEDLEALVARGHEVGCHTFSHVAVSTLNKAMLESEIRNNAAFMEKLLPGYVLQSFSYPFGRVSPMGKLRLQRRFSSCRGIQPGINAEVADMGLLRATSIYGDAIHPRIDVLLAEARKTCGWLVFYTHDVEATPSRFGCTPALFEQVVSMVAQHGLEVRTMQQGVEAIRTR